MTQEFKEKMSNTRTHAFSRTVYVLLTAAGLYFIFQGDIGMSMSTLGIALAFDPFDLRRRWRTRPAYQKIWLLIHLTVVFILMGVLISRQFD